MLEVRSLAGRACKTQTDEGHVGGLGENLKGHSGTLLKV